MTGIVVYTEQSDPRYVNSLMDVADNFVTYGVIVILEDRCIRSMSQTYTSMYGDKDEIYHKILIKQEI